MFNIKFTVCDINVNAVQKKGFTINRPHGVKDYVFVHFTSAAQIVQNDNENEIEPNSCIVFTPYQPAYYYSKDNQFSNNWFHFQGDGTIKILNYYNIPVNVVFKVARYDFIPLIIKDIMKEFYTKEYFWNEIINSSIHELFARIGRVLHEEKSIPYSPYKTDILENFKKIRIEIFNKLDNEWTIKQMAEMVNMSESRFSVLYKEFFGISPILELLTTRIDKAKSLLVNYNFKINEIAEMAGFNDTCYFTRQFKKTVGCTPNQYRNVHRM